MRRGVGAEWVFTKYSAIVGEMLMALGDRTLSPVIGKAVVGLLAARKTELSDLHCWIECWEVPLSIALRSDEVRGNVQIYALPGLFRLSPECFVQFAQGVRLGKYSRGNVSSGDEEDLMSLLCCLKVGRDLGFVDEITNTGNNGPLNSTPMQLPSSFVSPLLSHAHEHTRLAALTLTTYSPTLTKPLPTSAFRVLKSALPLLHAETDAEVRDLIIGSIRQLVERLGSSSYALNKDLQGLQKNAIRVPRVQTIFARILGLKESITEAASFMNWYLNFLKTQLAPGASYQRVVTALRVLIIIIRSGVDPSLVDPDDKAGKKKGLLHWPPNVQVDLFDGAMKRVLIDCLFNPFDDVRTMAAEMLKFAPDCGGSLRVILERGLRGMNTSGRARDADGLARSIDLWFYFATKGSPESKLEELWGLAVASQSGQLCVVDWVLNVLELDYLKVAREDFQRAVRERPIYGLFSGLRLIFEGGGGYQGAFKGRIEKRLVSQILEYCVEIWRMSKDILCFVSPEGYVPQEMIDEEAEGNDDMDTQTVMSYCWRAVKESSALLGAIVGTADFGSGPQSLSKQDFSNIGNVLLEQLLDIRHRGAFSAVSPSFIELCSRCLATQTLSDLPEQWLSKSILQIVDKSGSITRRSAGLPYLIVGIVIADPHPDRPLLRSTFEKLEEFARLPVVLSIDGTKVNLPQVHALNCLKVMFADSHLSSSSQEFLGRGLELSVSCFASEVWAIRNCGIMLFTALVNRIFGKRMTGTVGIKDFLERYPEVASVLLRSLNGESDTKCVEQLYPALSLIARLQPSEGFDASAIEPAVIRCLSSRFWKIRAMAARSYSTLVSARHVIEVIDKLLRDAGESRKQNFVHGRLCAVKVLLDRRGAGSFEEIFGVLGRHWRILVESNNCAVTKASFLSLLNSNNIQQLLKIQPNDLAAQSLLDNLLEYCKTSQEVLQEVGQASTVGRSMLKGELAKHIYNLAAYSNDRIPTLISTISSEDEELALYTSSQLFSSPLNFDQDTLASLDATLWTIITVHPWDQLRTIAVNLLSEYPPPRGSPEELLQERCMVLLTLCTSASTEPCRIAALPALAKLTAHLSDPTASLLKEITKQVELSGHEDSPFPTRQAAVSAVKALSPILTFETFNNAYFCLYDFLHDDDEDIREEAARIVKSVTKGEHTLLPLASADTLIDKMAKSFSKDEEFVREVVSRVVVNGDVKSQLKQVCMGDKILFAREKQNLFLDVHGEVVRWATVLGGLPENSRFIEDTLNAVARVREFAKEMGEEGPAGWMREEEVWVMFGRVVEGLGVIKRWRGDCADEAREFLTEMKDLRTHELFLERLAEVLAV
ncbi:putative death-receptor fusion protein-domain-containing protein [Tuber brumale]|nr:putative death-receptor fusion protein-domain-containing protein [Tuber brumale]